MSQPKPQILHGVPYIVNELFQASAYSAMPTNKALPVFGTATPAEGIQLLPDWNIKAQAYLSEYRQTLRQKTEESLARLA